MSLPAEATAGAWVAFGIAQTGQLDKANAQTRDAVSIVQKCETLNSAAAATVQKPWWQFW